MSNVFVAEQKNHVRQILKSYLSRELDINLVGFADDGKTVLDKVTILKPDLVLLEVGITGVDSYTVCRKLKANRQTRNIPVIFFGISSVAVDRVKAFEVGGADCISKPFQIEETLARIKNQLIINSAKLATEKLNTALKKEIQKAKRYVIRLESINQQLQNEIEKCEKTKAQLIHDTLHDGLTGLPNRTLLKERIDLAIYHATRNPNYLFALLFIDLDGFKSVNDSMGHLIGDKLLVLVAKLFQEDLRESDTVARLGGDEFVILLSDIQHMVDAILVSDRIQKKLSLPLFIEDRIIRTGASIGIAFGSMAYQESSQILQDADTAMYKAKKKGKGCYEIFSSKSHLQKCRHQKLESDI